MVLECENILAQEYIRKRASENHPEIYEMMQRDALNLCSIGRISYAKNYDNIPYIAQLLKNLGLKFKWFIIGPGEHKDIDALSRSLGVEDLVEFVGASDNPYVWLKACDIYVHPSRYEGKSIVVREAQILCKPVIITNYPTAKSQINSGIDGVICGMSNKQIAKAIYDLSKDVTQRDKIISYLQASDFAGIEEVDKIYDIINEK